jgi:hypothetical protein
MPLSVRDKLGPYEILAPVAITVSGAQFSERFKREAKPVAVHGKQSAPHLHTAEALRLATQIAGAPAV